MHKMLIGPRLKRAGALVFLLACVFSLALLVKPALAQDPAGSATGGKSDIVGMTANAPTADDLTNLEKTEPLAAKVADAAGQNRTAINLVWLLITGFMVMFMQAGFAMVETGFCRKKNAAHVMMTNFMIYPIGMLGFYIMGFALMFGAVGALGPLGGTSPLTKGIELGPMLGSVKMGLLAWNPDAFFLRKGVYDVGVFAFFLFQMVFMDTTCTIPTGAMAERWKFSAFVVYGFIISTLIYPIFGNWVWGGGWLAMLGQAFKLGNGVADFAGSSVVHMVGGFVALAGAIALGPRLGKFNRDGSSNVLPAHNLPMAMIGTFILAFGWFGFNPGSMLGASGGGMLRIGIVAVVTMLASASGAVAAMFFWWAKYKKPDPSMCVNGMLAGLVAITAPSGWVNATGAMIIGAVAGVLVCIAVPAVEKMKIDDPVGAFSVHGICGAWGVLSVGLFADGTFGGGLNGVSTNVTGLFYGGGMGQLMAQVIGVVVCGVWSFSTGYAFFKIQDKVMGIRPSSEDELMGLDVPEMGVEAYPEDRIAHGHSHGTPAPVPVPAGALTPAEA
jgi:ammonium transporter, Amt family